MFPVPLIIDRVTYEGKQAYFIAVFAPYPANPPVTIEACQKFHVALKWWSSVDPRPNREIAEVATDTEATEVAFRKNDWWKESALAFLTLADLDDAIAAKSLDRLGKALLLASGEALTRCGDAILELLSTRDTSVFLGWAKGTWEYPDRQDGEADDAFRMRVWEILQQETRIQFELNVTK